MKGALLRRLQSNKRYFRTFGAAFGLLLVLLVTACSPIEKDFIGKWQVYKVRVSNEWLGEKKLDAATTNRVKQIRFEFLSDGKMIFTDYTGESRPGKWKLRREEYIDIEYELSGMHNGSSVKESSLEIVSINGSRLVLRESFENGDEITYYLEQK